MNGSDGSKRDETGVGAEQYGAELSWLLTRAARDLWAASEKATTREMKEALYKALRELQQELGKVWPDM